MKESPLIDQDLARTLLKQQFPDWADLPLRLLDPAGSDHVIHRLGDDMALRLPRGDWAAGQAVKEHRWLPRIAPSLPLAVPVPLALGEPDGSYSYHWSVARWLDGSTPTPEAQHPDTPTQLAEFLHALQSFDPASPGLPAGPDLRSYDPGTRTAIAATAHVFDAPAMTALWDAALHAPHDPAHSRWLHGDFHTGNLLADADGRLTAVIDFGGLGVGDPSVDLMVAYTLLDPAARAAFRTALAPDDATWLRGMGWALATGLNAYTHYAATHPRVAAQTSRQITQALAEFRLAG
ncbi:aminoglycoside phosphotransferase family protein [Streptomyces sp. NPDC087440]|uniref:aminoglycoside phosphotransferase family protein n=1 Tax=Streptomyces sp. NPDC087440 TaxID=3365790 RepID=UPI0038215360